MTKDSFETILQDHADELYAQAIDAVPFLNYMRKKGMTRKWRGNTVKVPIKKDNTRTGIWVGEYATIPIPSFGAASYDIKRLTSRVYVDGGISTDNPYIIELLEAKKMEIAREISLALERSMIYGTATGVNEVVSLRAAADNNSVIGGIDQSANAFWRWQTNTNQTVLSLEDLDLAIASIIKEGGRFMVCLCSPVVMRYLANLILGPRKFISNGDALGIGAQIGYEYLPYAGGIILGDHGITDNDVFFAIGDGIKLLVPGEEKMSFEVVSSDNADYDIIRWYWTGNLIYESMRTNYFRSGFTLG